MIDIFSRSSQLPRITRPIAIMLSGGLYFIFAHLF